MHHPTWPGLRDAVREELAWVSAQEVGAAEEGEECGLTFWE